MSKLDLVIFGATGFTGRKAVEEMARLSKKANITWGVAGRSQKKLEDVLEEAKKNTNEDVSNVRIIIADISDNESLVRMCSQATVLVNCCGPYQLYGEAVTKACIEAKTHQVDVSGEPQYIEQMQLKYDAVAREAGVLIVSACGFDSIPNDMGVVFLQQNFGGVVNSVESYITANLPTEHFWTSVKYGTIHYGTWESLVNSLANWKQLAPLRKQLYPTRLPTFKPKLKSRSVIHRTSQGYALPFLGADGSIVYRTQRHFYENDNQRPIQFKPYILFASLYSVLMVLLSGLIIFVMSKTEFTRRLLLDYPRLYSMGMVSHSGPKEEVMNSTTFSVKLVGRGWEKAEDVETKEPNKTVVAMVRGVNPGYGATVTALLWSAITILQQRDKIQATGGVLTTGAAFHKTDLTKRLNENNLTFEIVQK